MRTPISPSLHNGDILRYVKFIQKNIIEQEQHQHGFYRARNTVHQLRMLLHLYCDYGIIQLHYLCFRDVGVGQITPFNNVNVCVKHGKLLLVCPFFLLAKWQQRCKATYVALILQSLAIFNTSSLKFLMPIHQTVF
uniref:Uncharacterized protein n=1 Tax=Glossina pallidipes TaxID=7398 RepID=A0A1A9Z9X9_GLOPL